MIAKENLQDLYPLAPMQEGMLHASLLAEGADPYHEQVLYRLSGALAPARMESAWQQLVRRHDALRTAFVYEKVKRPLQAVLRDRPAPFAFEDLRALDADAQAVRLRALCTDDRADRFDLHADPLMRMRVLQTGDDAFAVLWSLHHILMDGWCVGRLLDEFTRIYAALAADQTPDLPQPVPYARYIQWLEARDRAAAAAWWRDALADLKSPTALPHPQARPPADDAPAAEHCIDMGPDRSARLREAAADWGVTPGAVFFAAWGALLARYNDADEAAFGVVTSGRPADLPGVEDAVGLFINTVPLRVRADDAATLKRIAHATHAAWLDGEPHHHLPLAEILRQSPVGADLVNHVVALETYPPGAGDAGPFRIESIERHESMPYDFALVILPGTSFTLSLRYREGRLESDVVARAGEHLLRLLDHGLTMDAPPLADCTLHDGDTCGTLEGPALPSATARADGATFASAFAKVAVRQPDRPAVADDRERFSYAALDRLANGLAAALRDRYGVAPEERVGVAVSRSARLPLAFLATLKAGGAYVPLDPEHPVERHRALLQDADCAAVLADAARVPGLNAALPDLPVLDINAWTDTAADPPETAANPAALAYIIYTSGSTGAPKGVMVEHCALLNLCAWTRNAFALAPDCRMTLFASPAFDASIWELAPPLLAGGELVAIPEDRRSDPDALVRFLADEGITHTFLPPAVCAAVCSHHACRLADLRIQTGGDVLGSVGDGAAAVTNNYGPTECTVPATSGVVTGGQAPFPIGRPVANTEILILDPRGRPGPRGTPRRRATGAAAPARGPRPHPDPTPPALLPHPNRPDARIYRTGDRGRVRSDGLLEFLGRIDDQVKIGGHRIEPAEVEALLRRHPGVHDAGVVPVAAPDGTRRLVAFLEPDGEAADPEALRAWCHEQAPAYLIPARFATPEALPRTGNGKLDRAALVESARTAPDTTPYRAPASPTEETVAAIWAEVLEAERIGADDNFFDRGGHSLAATRVLSRLRGRFGVELPLSEIFATPTVAALAAAVDRLAAAPTTDTTPAAGPIRRVDRAAYRSGAGPV